MGFFFPSLGCRTATKSTRQKEPTPSSNQPFADRIAVRREIGFRGKPMDAPATKLEKKRVSLATQD